MTLQFCLIGFRLGVYFLKMALSYWNMAE